MRTTRFGPFSFAVCLALFLGAMLGCGGRPKVDLDRGRQAVVAVLDHWKANEPADRLRTLADPVDFADELRGSFTLVDYSLGSPRTDDPAVLRFPVTLRLRDRKGADSEREVVFAVKLGSPVIVTRDPFF